jgi:hypothetical protein
VKLADVNVACIERNLKQEAVSGGDGKVVNQQAGPEPLFDISIMC